MSITGILDDRSSADWRVEEDAWDALLGNFARTACVTLDVAKETETDLLIRGNSGARAGITILDHTDINQSVLPAGWSVVRNADRIADFL